MNKIPTQQHLNNKIMKELITIQSELKAPKNQTNKFGGYKYRSAEDILEAVKPLLNKTKTFLTISDDMVCEGGHFYVKATATLTNEQGVQIQTTAFAREEETKRGMDASQITGAASSYARKYALNGLFCIDDTKDADFSNTHDKVSDVEKAIDEVRECVELSRLKAIWEKYPDLQNNKKFIGQVNLVKATLQNLETTEA